MFITNTRVLKTVAVFMLIMLGAACQPGPNEPAASTGATPSPTATPLPSPTGTPIGTVLDTREPDRYQAILFFNAEAKGRSQSLALPIEVARNGSDRRYAFNLPAIGQLIFLDRADKSYLIVPARRQYAELGPELLGFNFRLLTPGQIALHLQKLRGVERVGEEQLNERPVIKYRHTGLTRTGTQAGDVTTESFIYVDKETGLPLRAESLGQATGQVKGSNQGFIVMQLKDLRTDVDPKVFEVPTEMRKLTPEEIKQQLNALAAIFQVVLSGLNAQTATGATPTGVTPAPTGTASPTYPRP